MSSNSDSSSFPGTDGDFPTIDGAEVQCQTLKSKRANPCSMCDFSDWEIGDTKYVVEHWKADSHNSGREHLCPACAVSRGLDYEEYYKRNQNAPFKAKDEIILTEEAYQEAKQKEKKAKRPRTTTYLSGTNEMEDRRRLLIQKVSFDLSQAKIPACTIRVHPTVPLFVAWSGTLVLVFEGFPSSFVDAKKEMETSVPNLKLENFGSKWSKTTLAVVFDNAPPLSLADWNRLKGLCQEYGQKISMIMNSIKMDITKISIVDYECRSLEKIRHRQTIDLEKNGFSHRNTDRHEIHVVQSVVKEWDDPNEYLSKVNNAESSYMSSYRTPNEGMTCVAFLEGLLLEQPVLRQILVDFRISIDLALPGRYAWLAEKSWHCTLRSLDCTT